MEGAEDISFLLVNVSIVTVNVSRAMNFIPHTMQALHARAESIHTVPAIHVFRLT